MMGDGSLFDEDGKWVAGVPDSDQEQPPIKQLQLRTSDPESDDVKPPVV